MLTDTEAAPGGLYTEGMIAIGRRATGACVIVAVATALARPHAAVPVELPRRLVLAVDGLGFADVQAAQQAGAFARFFPVSRLVSTFPSNSDIAWSEIFHTAPPPGYQRIYFDLGAGRMKGGTLDTIRPIEFEKRMNLGFVQKTHHLASYMRPRHTARAELEALARAFFESRGVETFFAYLPAPDAMQHVRGDVRPYLARLDAALTALLDAYRGQTGTDLEVVLLSDHGNNQRGDAEAIDMARFLEDRGYRARDVLRGPHEVIFTTDGVTTGLGLFVQPGEVRALAEALANLHGVELVTAVDAAPWPHVEVRDSLGGVAWIARRANGDLAYLPKIGDPLRYGPLAARLREAGRLDGDGFASEAAWFEVSHDHEYPAALDRIMRGHYDVTTNPAPILVSIKDGFQVSNGVVGFLNHLRPLGGTHGGLNARNALGVVLSTFRSTVDASTHDVAAQFDGFDSLPPLRARTTHRR